MSIFGKTPKTPKAPAFRRLKEDTSIFGGKQYIKMSEAGRRLGKTPSRVPGFPRPVTKQEIKQMAQGLEKKYGSYLKQKDKPRILKDLQWQKSKAPTIAEKMKIEKQTRFLKRGLLGQ